MNFDKINFDKMRKIMKVLGFSDQAISEQIKELERTIFLKAWEKILEEKGKELLQGRDSFGVDEMKKFITENREEVIKKLGQTTNELTRAYLKTITEGVSQDKLDRINAILAEK